MFESSIFGRLFRANAAVLAAVFVVISISMTVFVTHYTSDKQYESVTEAAQNIESMTALLRIENTGAQERTLYTQNLRAWSEFINADIIVVNNVCEVYETTIENTAISVPAEYADVLNAHIVKDKGDFGGLYDRKVLTVGVPLYYDGAVVGAMFFNTPMPELNGMVGEILCMFAVSAVITLIFAFGFIYIQANRISKPIKEINRAAMDIAAGRFEQRMMVTTTDEIGQLASSFNFMADSLERLEQMRSSFVSDVSHELRTPMTSISGFIQGILDGTIPEEKHDEYLNIVLDETKRLTRLVNNMLESSKISSLQYNLDMGEFDITEMVRRAVIQLENKISQKDLELEVDFEDEVIKVMADGDSIRRVIINVLDNAVKFSYNNTKIGIKVWTEGSKVLTSIGNYGMGLEGTELRTVFDRFYKTDKSRSNDKQGAGLGLYLVKNIMQCHKQDIWVESTPVPGANMRYTKFTFTLEKV